MTDSDDKMFTVEASPNHLVSDVKTLIKERRGDLEEVDFNVYQSNVLLEDTKILREIGQTVELNFQIGKYFFTL